MDILRRSQTPDSVLYAHRIFDDFDAIDRSPSPVSEAATARYAGLRRAMSVDVVPAAPPPSPVQPRLIDEATLAAAARSGNGAVPAARTVAARPPVMPGASPRRIGKVVRSRLFQVMKFIAKRTPSPTPGASTTVQAASDATSRASARRGRGGR